MKKYNLGIVELDNEIVLFNETKKEDLEIENFKSMRACTRFLNKNFKRIDNSKYKYNGVYIKRGKK